MLESNGLLEGLFYDCETYQEGKDCALYDECDALEDERRFQFDYLKSYANSGDVKRQMDYAIACWKVSTIEGLLSTSNRLSTQLNVSSTQLKEGLDYFERAAAQDDQLANLILGLIYTQPEGAFENTEKGLEHLKQAANKGSYTAQERLGYHSFFGKNVPIDKAYAFSMWTQAAERGNALAQLSLAYFYYREHNDLESALHWCIQANAPRENKSINLFENKLILDCNLPASGLFLAFFISRCVEQKQLTEQEGALIEQCYQRLFETTERENIQRVSLKLPITEKALSCMIVLLRQSASYISQTNFLNEQYRIMFEALIEPWLCDIIVNPYKIEFQQYASLRSEFLSNIAVILGINYACKGEINKSNILFDFAERMDNKKASELYAHYKFVELKRQNESSDEEQLDDTEDNLIVNSSLYHNNLKKYRNSPKFLKAYEKSPELLEIYTMSQQLVDEAVAKASDLEKQPSIVRALLELDRFISRLENYRYQNSSIIKDIIEKAKLHKKNIELDEKNKELKLAHKAREAAQEDVLIKEQQHRKDIEALMSMFAHKFRGPVDSIEWNSQHYQDVVLYEKAVHTMRSLLDIFSLISTSPEKLVDKLTEDCSGTATLESELQNALEFTLPHLLSESKCHIIRQHYIRYAYQHDLIDNIVSKKLWKDDYLDIEVRLQKTWENEFSELFKKGSSLIEISTEVSSHFFPLEIKGFDDKAITFEKYHTKSSYLLIILSELLTNCFKYYDSSTFQPVRLTWQPQAECEQLLCETPSTSLERKTDKGSGKGHVFLKQLVEQVGGEFSHHTPTTDEEPYRVEIKFPTSIFRKQNGENT